MSNVRDVTIKKMFLESYNGVVQGALYMTCPRSRICSHCKLQRSERTSGKRGNLHVAAM